MACLALATTAAYSPPMPAPARVARCVTISLASIVAATILLPPCLAGAGGACTIQRSADAGQRSADGSGPFTLHLGKHCTEQEREAQAVPAADLLKVLAEGRDVDVSGVLIVGDLELDGLPARRPEDLTLPPRVRPKLADMHVSRLHVLSGAVSIRDARVRGTIKTNVNQTMLLVRGALIMTGTTFGQMLDLSRTVFLGPVDFSGAVLLQQGFFIEALFDQPARFEKTAFGTHTRFHKAVFGDNVTFHRAGFNGLSEFIQVMFDKDARFSQTYFKMGTGFSGSRFRGLADFSETTFEREAYFSFAMFEGDAYFRRATFRADANFADAQFQGVDDFSKTWFNIEPQFTRAKVRNDQAIPKGLQDPRVLYVIAATLLAFSLIFAFVLRKG
jgi:uncharacterized protein YjbI with pentapeptide repeats